MKKIRLLDDILPSNDMCIVEFTGPNCPACDSVKRKLSNLEKAYSGIGFFEIDVEESPEEAAKYGVMGVPSLLFLADGMIVDMVVGDCGGIEERIKAFVRMGG